MLKATVFRTVFRIVKGRIPATFVQSCSPYGALFALKERCNQVGLQVKDAKCHAHSRTRGAAKSVSATTGATHALRGLVVAGTPLIEDEFAPKTATGKAEEGQCAVATLISLPL